MKDKKSGCSSNLCKSTYGQKVGGESWDIEYFLTVKDWFIRKSPRSTTVVKVPLAVAIFLLLQQGLWVTNLCEE